MMRAVSPTAAAAPATASDGAPQHWRIIVPVRGGSAGKSRLSEVEGRRLRDADRRELTMAMARDTVTAAVRSGRGTVAVLTADGPVATMASDCGAWVIHDAGRGLNAELIATAGASGLLPPHTADPAGAATAAGEGICVVLGDLPCLLPADLCAVLDVAERAPAAGVVVADEDGTGTTTVAYAAHYRGTRTFRFGPGSAEQHRQAGLRIAGADRPRLRCDVDTSAGWDRAVELGLGAATSALRERLLGRTVVP